MMGGMAQRRWRVMLGAVCGLVLIALLVEQSHGCATASGGAMTEPDPIRRAITNSFLFYPVRGQWRMPDELGMAYQAVDLVAADDVRIQAWWIPAPVVQDRGVTVLFLHGNAGTMADRLENAQAIHDLGYSLLMLEYRGYGDSEGSPSERGLYQDASAALAEARLRSGAQPVVVFGRSLGGAVAIELASQYQVDGLIVESSFTSLAEMAVRTGIPLATTFAAYDFDSLKKIARVTAPVLLIHGDADEVVPYEMGERLRDAVTAPLTFQKVAGGTHNDTWLRGGAAYWQAWRSFLDGVREQRSR